VDANIRLVLVLSGVDGFPTKNDIPRTESSSVRKEIVRLVDLVKENASPQDVPQANKYIKTDLELLGVRMPILDSIAKEFYDQHKKDGDLKEVHLTVEELWAVPIFDVKTLAISILRRFRRKLEASTFEVVKTWLDDIDNWAHCDGLSVYVLGSILLKEESVISEIMGWTKSGNLWKRRAALISTMLGNRAGKGDPFWTLTMLNDVLDDDEYYVKKTFGWVLREMGKGYPDFVFEYMMYNKSKFNKTDVKEALKHLPEEQRKTVIETDFSI
jgi:3-methyladenine DNA glycosylase AlkD